MAVGTDYENWAVLPDDVGAAFTECSPNLVELRKWCENTWGLVSLGCYGERPIRGSLTVKSAHWWGAAIDLRYAESIDRATVDEVVLPTMIRWSYEMGIQAIHDYLESRIWHAGRTASLEDSEDLWWRAQPPSPVTGMGQKWAGYLHVETCRAAWWDNRPIDARAQG